MKKIHGPINLRFRILAFRSRKILLLVKKKTEKYLFCNSDIWKWFGLNSSEAVLLF